MDFSKIETVESLLLKHYNLQGQIRLLVGELDLNFKITTQKGDSFILKISRINDDLELLHFQTNILLHLQSKSPDISSPIVIQNSEKEYITTVIISDVEKRHIRLLTWIEGRLWSDNNYRPSHLRESLGTSSGMLCHALVDFSDKNADRNFDWNLSDAAWTTKHLNLFQGEKRETVNYYQRLFNEINAEYKNLRKSVIHNDANDNNILVSNDLNNPNVVAIIDYGDAVRSQTINELAVVICYGIMDLEDPLAGAKEICKGFYNAFKVTEDEIKMLYTLVGMRLVVSVTKSAINKSEFPENEYLQISDAQAWKLLKKWRAINQNFAHYAFRQCCGLYSHPDYQLMESFLLNQKISANELFKTKIEFERIDLSLTSSILGNYADYKESDVLDSKMKFNYFNYPKKMWVGGYGEIRPFYSSDAFITQTNDGIEYRTVHLGVDFWAKAETEIISIFDGEVYACQDNAGNNNYGPTLILKHEFSENQYFYTLYGHLGVDVLKNWKIGDKVKKGEILAEIGSQPTNGNWTPHLHFQIIMDMLGNKHDFIGVSKPSEWDIYKCICPDPNLIFNLPELVNLELNERVIETRKKHLGRSLSLSYNSPLEIVRGEGVFLIDRLGQKYLDTVNNVAHVGHENPTVVHAGTKQMQLLNTNTRYLSSEITDYVTELLAFFPKELSVVHFVNSGSEANELALRMAKTYTKQKDIIALEMGYHGNTQACIDISSYKFNRKGGAGKPEYTSIVPLPDSFRGLHRGNNTGEKYAEYVDEALDNLNSKNRGIAAFIAESIVSCGGQIELPEGYLKSVYKKVRAAGGLCIADEVQVGFGRVGEAFWGFQLHDVTPDIVVLGKPIGNGHPLAAVVCTEKVADAFNNGMEFFNTFGGNPVSCAIGRAVLKEIKLKTLQNNALETGNYLKAQLGLLAKGTPIIAQIRGKGLFLGIELEEKNKPATEKTAYISERMRQRGILMSVDGPHNNVLKIKPPIIFSKSNADFLVENLMVVLKEDYIKKPF